MRDGPIVRAKGASKRPRFRAGARSATEASVMRLLTVTIMALVFTVAWWAFFYGNLALDTGRDLFATYGDAAACLVWTTDTCNALIASLAEAAAAERQVLDPFLVYSPWVFVVAVAQLAPVALLLTYLPNWLRITIYRIFALEVLILLWWIASSTSPLVPSPAETWAAAELEFVKVCPPSNIPTNCKTIWTALFGMDFDRGNLGSVIVYLLGYAAAAFIGILIGLLLGGFRPLGRTLEVFINGLMATPRIAFIPVIIVFLGLFYEAKVFIIFLGAVLPIIVNTYAGVLNADGELVEMARSAGASRAQIFRRILLPGSLPFIVVGLRVGATIGLINTVVAELYTANSGLGSLLRQYSQEFRMANYFVVVLVLATLGIIVTQLLRIIESRADRWRYRGR
jgi:NitT/TauT family transport system permease protein